MGRPVILPRTNLGRFVRHGEDAWVLDKVDALGIVNAVLELRANKALSERLAAGSLAFAREHFDWKKNTSALLAFYEIHSVSRRKEDYVGAPS
jgi:glycosyltransferase involved in cell wall biosynthesis